MYKTDLEKDIVSNTSGDFCKLTVALAKGRRAEDDSMPMISNAGVKRKGTDIPKGISIMTEQVCITFRKNLKVKEGDMLKIRSEFKRKYGMSLHYHIQEDSKGNYQEVLLCLWAKDTPGKPFRPKQKLQPVAFANPSGAAPLHLRPVPCPLTLAYYANNESQWGRLCQPCLGRTRSLRSRLFTASPVLSLFLVEIDVHPNGLSEKEISPSKDQQNQGI
ncbi:hypothetical protein GH733_019465 [Mirounga leonina]|nr:hypothetical protein GH733_019465 [Mirounga leonina]